MNFKAFGQKALGNGVRRALRGYDHGHSEIVFIGQGRAHKSGADEFNIDVSRAFAPQAFGQINNGCFRRAIGLPIGQANISGHTAA